MIKVKILQDVGLGLAGAAAALAGTGQLGCATETADSAGTTNTAVTDAVSAGTGKISLDYYEFAYASTSGGDEFIRVGEKLTIEASAAMVSEFIASNSAPSTYAVVAEIVYQGLDGSSIGKLSVPMKYAKTSGSFTSQSFKVAKNAPELKVTLSVTADGKTYEVGANDYTHNTFAVFGAFLPNKLILFDNDAQGALRSRVIEGGKVVPGANVTVAYTDWRADGVVDKVSLNTLIGDGQVYSRFGISTVPISGQLTYEITAWYSTDGGTTWTNGVLEARDNPDVLDFPGQGYRTAYEKTFQLPNGASDLKIGFEVKAVLVADPRGIYIVKWYDKPGTNTPYQLGEHVALKDVSDNLGGQNYDFPAGK
jgi:hypothetical protein